MFPGSPTSRWRLLGGEYASVLSGERLQPRRLVIRRLAAANERFSASLVPVSYRRGLLRMSSIVAFGASSTAQIITAR